MRMAASSARRTEGPCKMLFFAFLVLVSLFNAGVVAQSISAQTVPPLHAEARGDMILKSTKAPGPEHSKEQTSILPTVELTATTEEDTAKVSVTATQQVVEEKVQTSTPKVMEVKSPAPMPSRGDGPRDKPKPEPQEEPQEKVICVSKEVASDKNAVRLDLKTSSSCKDTKLKIESVLQQLCAEDCKLELYQEENSKEALVFGKTVEADVNGMTSKFNNDNIKHKTDIEKAVPHSVNPPSKWVLVTLLLSGLLLAALLVAGYYLKTRRKNSKGVKLAESFQVDEENQANTLVSVAPLPQEPIDKPTANGESPPENGTNPAPATNGHSQTQTQVADTQM
ncbi:hematopoietic progenitor cell antigen CD34 [Channa argus]